MKDFNKLQSKTKVMILKAIKNKYHNFVTINTYELKYSLKLYSDDNEYEFNQNEIYSVDFTEL